MLSTHIKRPVHQNWKVLDALHSTGNKGDFAALRNGHMYQVGLR